MASMDGVTSNQHGTKVDPEEYLTELSERSDVPELLPGFCLNFISLHERKLWKQLTDELMRFYDLSESKPYRMDIYTNFIEQFAKHMSQLKRVLLAVSAANADSTSPQQSLDFVTKVAQQVDQPNSRDAFVYAEIEVARLQLVLGDADKAKASAAKAGEVLDTFDSVDPLIHAAYYRVMSDYHKAKAEYTQYYRTSLLYLACVKLEDMTDEEKALRAHDLSLSALLGERIYNFGELLLHPILNALDGTPHSWLKEFVVAMNAGDLLRFEGLLKHLPQQPLLESQLGFLRQKVCLMALIESVFRRPPHDRVLGFATIAQETRLPIYEVEHLVMKALSLDLIRGAIDEVDSIVEVSWVQPRVLDLAQIESMRSRLLDWTHDVKKVESLMHAQAKSFIEV
ncbi:26S proteasome regulatory subunit [Savitreella phatthalungensis]